MKRVVIVGGGFCGAQAAKVLEKKLPAEYEIVLFDCKDYFQFTPSIHKVMTDPDYSDKICFSYSSFLKRTIVIKDEVLQVSKTEVTTAKKKYSFEYAVIASGAHTTKPNNSICVLKTVDDAKEIGKKLAKAKNVVIIGGGYTGVEVAGELVTKTDKNITVIHGPSRLLERQSEETSQKSADFLEKKGAQLIFNQHAKLEKKHAVLEDGTKVPADLILWCVGIRPNNQCLKKFKQTKHGYLPVQKTLLMKGSKNIFVGGDIADLKEEKSAQHAEHQGATISCNIVRSVEGKNLKNYVCKPSPMIVSLGDSYGILTKPTRSLGGLIPALMKKFIEVMVVSKFKYL